MTLLKLGTKYFNVDHLHAIEFSQSGGDESAYFTCDHPAREVVHGADATKLRQWCEANEHVPGDK